MHIHNNIVSWELKKTCSGGGKSFEDTDGGAPLGTLHNLRIQLLPLPACPFHLQPTLLNQYAKH